MFNLPLLIILRPVRYNNKNALVRALLVDVFSVFAEKNQHLKKGVHWSVSISLYNFSLKMYYEKH